MDWSTVFYWAIIAFIIIDFAIGLWLTALTVKASRWPVPKVLEGLYDEDAYRKQQAYSREKRRLGFITSSLAMVLSLAFFAFGGFAWLDSVVRGMSGNDIVRAVLFFGFFFVVEFILSIPFSIYSTFSIEQRYGFNKTTPKLFAADAVKGFLLSAVLSGGLLAVAVWIYSLNPDWFWLIAFGVFTGFTLFFTYFYSELIVPLFNKQTPLEDGSLRDAIEAFAKDAGFELENIYVMDESKRTTKANAYFTGFGRKKRVVLFDTLILLLTPAEIVGVLAHEIGHYKKRHLVKSIISAAAESLLLFWVVSLILGSPTIAAAAGCSEPSFWINVQVFSMLLAPLGLVQGLVDNAVSRKHEREADGYSRGHGCGPAEASALMKMSAQALSNLTPHPVVVRFEYSHPTLAERVESLLDPVNWIWDTDMLSGRTADAKILALVDPLPAPRERNGMPRGEKRPTTGILEDDVFASFGNTPGMDPELTRVRRWNKPEDRIKPTERMMEALGKVKMENGTPAAEFISGTVRRHPEEDPGELNDLLVLSVFESLRLYWGLHYALLEYLVRQIQSGRQAFRLSLYLPVIERIEKDGGEGQDQASAQ